MNYKLELKQIVEFPRCRIYRDFIQTLITTKSMRYWISWLTTSPIFPTAPITGNAGLRLKHSVPSFGDLLQKRHWIRSTSSFQSNTYRLSPRLFVIS